MCFLRHLDFRNLSLAEIKFWAKMEEMVSDISVKTSIFQPCSFINSLNYSGTFKEERRGLSLTAGVNQQLTGWRGKEQVPRETSGRKREAILCSLSVSWAPATYNSSFLNILCHSFHSIEIDI